MGGAGCDVDEVDVDDLAEVVVADVDDACDVDEVDIDDVEDVCAVDMYIYIYSDGHILRTSFFPKILNLFLEHQNYYT